jgi:hypothetical protein
MVNAIGNLKDICRISVCLLDELWLKDMVKIRHFFHILRKFDVVMLYYSQTANQLSEKIGRRCLFLPPGVDAILFCPYPDSPRRVIDLYSMGRRLDITHQRLLRLAQKTGLFYLYDSIAGSQAINPKEHRMLLANLTKRTRYFIVNPGKFDQPDMRGNQIEIGNRYFEGAASGTIMIGERPQTEEFDKLFDWPEAVIQLPCVLTDIDMLIKGLDSDRERLDKLRRTNVIHALMRHDWAYRWEAILRTVGLESVQGVLERKDRLKKLAETVVQEG